MARRKRNEVFLSRPFATRVCGFVALSQLSRAVKTQEKPRGQGISLISQAESYSNKQSSFKSYRYFFGVPKQRPETACSLVASPMTGYKDKKHSLIGQVSTGEFGAKQFFENETEAVIAYFTKGMLFSCDQPFLWGERCVTSQKTAAEETTRDAGMTTREQGWHSGESTRLPPL